MIIDAHNHYMPQENAIALGAVPGKQVTVMEGGIPKRTLHDRMFMPEKRLLDMDEAGISTQLISSGGGWNASLEACQPLNDHLSNLQKQHKGRFICMAAVPLGASNSDKPAIEELHRAVDKLGLRGVGITAQPFGIPLDDKRFWAFYKEAESMGVAIALHPSHQIKGFAALDKYDLQRSAGREIELIISICRVVNGGILDDFPKIKIVFSHFGGGISALLERIASTVEIERVRWQQPCSSNDFRAYMKRLYFDTSGYVGGMVAFRLAYEVLGPSQLLFGTDYPQDFMKGEDMKTYIQNIKKFLKKDEYDRIMLKNTIDVFGLAGNV